MQVTKHGAVLALLLSLLLTGCEFRCSVGGDTGTTDKPKAQKGPRLYNNIQLNTTAGVKVNRAYLANENGERISEENLVQPKGKTKFVIFIDSGWVSSNGRCYLGASQKVTTDGGRVLMDEADLFESMGLNGIDPEDAKIITLSVLLNIPENAPPEGLKVEYRVWDKKGPGNINGQYKIFTK